MTESIQMDAAAKRVLFADSRYYDIDVQMSDPEFIKEYNEFCDELNKKEKKP